MNSMLKVESQTEAQYKAQSVSTTHNKMLLTYIALILCLSMVSCSSNISNQTTDPLRGTDVSDLKETSNEIIEDTKSIKEIDISLASQQVMTLCADNYRDIEYIETVTDFFASLSLDNLDGTNRAFPDHVPVDFTIKYADNSEVCIVYDIIEQTLYRYTKKDADYCVAYKIQPPIKSPLDFASDLSAKKARDDKLYAERMSKDVSANIKEERLVFPDDKIISIVITDNHFGKENSVRYELDSDIEEIKVFFQTLVLKLEESDYPSQLSGSPSEICFFFENGTFIKISMILSMRSAYLKINSDYYDIGQEQFEALINTINIRNWYYN